VIVLGVETSCDETAAAVVSDAREILANPVLSQLAEHAPYGGVVPEIAARSHLDHIDRLVGEALAEARIGLDALDGIAVTGGPGLIGGVIVGVMTAKTLAQVTGKPLVNVNHLEAHALTCRLTDGVEFPYLLLLVTGGHTQLVAVEGVGRYCVMGTTIDDAAGEAFDKTAKLLGLAYPGGPALERCAGDGNATRFDLPRPLAGRAGSDFSFSGLKTAVAQLIAGLATDGALDPGDAADVAASFQEALADAVCDRTRNALETFASVFPQARTLVVSGGVAANGHLRTRLATLAEQYGFDLKAPPLALCSDNAAMVAWAGVERLRLGLSDRLDFRPRPRWPLGEVRGAA
jgi:N6-L-threonylcarbamoyladenine synthase